jgi:hypothetical protein
MFPNAAIISTEREALTIAFWSGSLWINLEIDNARIQWLQIFETLYYNILESFRGRIKIKELAVERFIFTHRLNFLHYKSNKQLQSATEDIFKKYPDGLKTGLADKLTIRRAHDGSDASTSGRIIRDFSLQGRIEGLNP